MKRLLPLLTALALAACGKPEAPYTQESYVFGTRVQLAIWGIPQAKARQAAAAVLSDLDRLHGKIACVKPGQLTALNRGFADGPARSRPMPNCAGLLLQAQDYARRSDQLQSGNRQALVAAWGFHADQFAPHPARARPSRAALLAARPTLDDLAFDTDSVSSCNPPVQMNLRRLAKGWRLDQEIDYLRQPRHLMVLNIGGNALAIGSKGGSPVGSVSHLPATAAATDGGAGIARRTIRHLGRLPALHLSWTWRYSHLIDPRNGQPAAGVQAAAVVVGNRSDAGALSDAATKPLFIGGSGSLIRYARKFDLNWILLIDARRQGRPQPAAQQRLRWLDNRRRCGARLGDP